MRLIKQNQLNFTVKPQKNRNGSVGNLNGKTGHLTKILDNLEHTKDRTYEYDALGRLTKAKGGATNIWQQTYAYDRFGNRTSVTATGVAANNTQIPSDGIANLAYDTNTNRITTSGFQYDLAGNQIRAQAADGSWLNFEYDTANQVRVIKRDDGTAVQGFLYGATGSRLMNHDQTTGEFIIYANLGGTTLAEYVEYTSAVPTWTKSYTYLGDSQLATITPNGSGGETVNFNHPDSLGTRTITNQQTGTSYEQAHLPFGTALDAETSMPLTTNNKRFTTYDRSAVTGLDYAVNRTYDSKQGRFTQVDPIKMSAVSLAAPQTLNLYSYCGNDPINHTDPNGLFWGFFKSLFKWVLVAIAVVVAVLTIIAAPATIAGILGAISAGANAASQVLNAAGFKKIGLIFGIIAAATGFGSIIAGKIGAQHLLASEGNGKTFAFGVWFAALGGVGAITNNFTERDDRENDRKWGRAFLLALAILQNNEPCRSYIAGNSATSDIISLDPAQDLWSRSQDGKIRDADTYNVEDASGRKGLAVTTQTVDALNPRRIKSTGNTTLGLIFYDDVGLKKALGISADAGRVEIMLHELKHALGGVHNGTKEEATWRENIRKYCISPYFKQ